MARRKTVDELLQEAEAGQSGGTLGEAEGIKRAPVLTEAEKKKLEEERKQGLGRRLRRTILNPFRASDDE